MINMITQDNRELQLDEAPDFVEELKACESQYIHFRRKGWNSNKRKNRKCFKNFFCYPCSISSLARQDSSGHCDGKETATAIRLTPHVPIFTSKPKESSVCLLNRKVCNIAFGRVMPEQTIVEATVTTAKDCFSNAVIDFAYHILMY